MPKGKTYAVGVLKKGGAEGAATGMKRASALARAKGTSLVRMTPEQVGSTVLAMVQRCGLEYGSEDECCAAVLPGMPLETARRYMEALAYVASGAKWSSVLAATGLAYADLTSRMNRREYNALFKAAKAMQLDAIAARTLESLDELANEGERIPVVAGGEVIDERRVRPVRAMELLLKAGDERFAEKGGGGIHTNGPTFVFPVMPTMTAEDVRRGREETEGVVVEGASAGEGSPAAEGGGSAGLLSGLEPEDVEEVEP